jgi:hypothetical protein
MRRRPEAARIMAAVQSGRPESAIRRRLRTGPLALDRAGELRPNAALGAAQEVGIAVSTPRRNTGWIFGRRGPAGIAVGVLPQPDGILRVRFDTKGLAPQDHGLDALLTKAYSRRMGR